MAYEYFSRSGKVLPVGQAVIPLDDIAYAYGFGVYETVRVVGGKPLFLDEHCRRLMGSARIIGLEHGFTPDSVAKGALELVSANKAENCNLKIMLIGAGEPGKAALDILCLNPRFPDRKYYKEGVHAITRELERAFPHAKTLNMLTSYLAHRDARTAGAYDALLVNRRGYVTEGTSTNFFALKDRTIFSPPEKDILLGVTRAKVLETAARNGFKLEEKELEPARLDTYESLFLTGTSVKIMPVRSVDRLELGPPSPALIELMRAFDAFLAEARN